MAHSVLDGASSPSLTASARASTRAHVVLVVGILLKIVEAIGEGLAANRRYEQLRARGETAQDAASAVARSMTR